MATLRTVGLVILLAPAFGGSFACTSTAHMAFHTPEDAIQAVAELASIPDSNRAEQVFGSGGAEVLRSGDPVADRADAQQVLQAIREKVAFEDRDANTKIALLGNDAWPFPIPLVSDEHGWRFDVEAGRDEIENRRIGRNELMTLATLHEFVNAQREYFSAGRDGNPPAYAARLISSEGKHDGLYWPAADGEPASPLGPLVADAAEEGYKRSEGEPTAYHGYYFRSLPGQGKRAPGGEMSYVSEKNQMARGFGLLAWPAKYGNSGVMTFQINQLGIVYQKDLGPSTASHVKGIKLFDPDDSWDPTGD